MNESIYFSLCKHGFSKHFPLSGKESEIKHPYSSLVLSESYKVYIKNSK